MARRKPKRKSSNDPGSETLDAILELLRNLFILVGRRAGLSRDQVRVLLGVDTHRVSQVWRHISDKRTER